LALASKIYAQKTQNQRKFQIFMFSVLMYINFRSPAAAVLATFDWLILRSELQKACFYQAFKHCLQMADK
jgi:hypothetical protein